MNILNINVMSGPNKWSVKRHRLMVMELDIGDLEHRPTNEIEGFYERITELIPGLCKHHCSEGKPGGFFDRVKDGTWMGHTIEHIEKIPLSFGGRARFMIENILAAVAVAYTQKISPAVIRKSLTSFKPSPEQTPGRMNLFQFENYDVLVDYCHNPAGLVAIKEFIENSSYLYRTGIICGIGDRREEGNLEIGRLSAELFCKIIIREDTDLRGKAAGESSAIVKPGIESSCFNSPVVCIPNEKQALLFAMENALPGTLIMLCAEKIEEVTSMLKLMQSREKRKQVEPAGKVLLMKKDLPVNMNFLQK